MTGPIERTRVMRESSLRIVRLVEARRAVLEIARHELDFQMRPAAVTEQLSAKEPVTLPGIGVSSTTLALVA
ncbi:MAG: hypothetical protein KF782_22905 [Labilithrix sp.]|nr:hypothetical protein [Labilithrix sp.]